ncbi:SRPBCC family protein [Chitinilyticum litopenaei]|uniref:SRPBCC family protein n=1 Tax=Chitinilyticum litopenaei TaxID=1121276 RepID=UPI00041C8E43|nr:SRPBCC family protein [Chitinilyticum litopenaei]
MPRLLALFALLFLSALLRAAEPSPVQVEVREDGGQLLIEARYQPPVAPALAHAVLTDYEAMPAFVPGLASSRIVGREGNVLRVSQQGRYRFGLLSLAAESLIRVELRGLEEIVCQSLAASQGEFRSTTRLQGQGEATRIVFQAVWQPGNGLLASLGAGAVREQIRAQLAGMQQEMLRRARLDGMAAAAGK